MDRNAWFHKKLILISGKGGVGKSAMAASLALQASQQKKKVVLVEQTIADVLPSFFKKENSSPSGQERMLTDKIKYLRIDGRSSFRDYVVKYLGMSTLYEKVLTNTKVQSLLEAIPGLAETMMLGQLFYICELAEQRPDIVIFDAPASGHFLNFLTTPDSLLRSGLVGPLVKEVARVRAFLASDACGITWVASPEELVVGETLDFLPRIKEKSPVPDLYLLVNRSVSSFKEELDRLFVLNPSDQRAQLAVDFVKEGMKRALFWENELLSKIRELRLCKDILFFPEQGSFSLQKAYEMVPKFF